jgi:hypothetical protein
MQMPPDLSQRVAALCSEYHRDHQFSGVCLFSFPSRSSGGDDLYKKGRRQCWGFLYPQLYPQQDVTLVLLANHNCDVWDLSWQIHELILEHLPEQRHPLFTVS